MLSAIEAVDLAAAIYPLVKGEDAPAAPKAFDWHGYAGDVYCGIRRYPDFDLVSCRGSVTGLDWFRDAISAAPTLMPGFAKLGLMPFGFSLGMPKAYVVIRGQLRAGMPVVFVGHSLGADEATELAAMHLVAGGKVAAVFAYEPPRSGAAELVDLLRLVPMLLTTNGFDPVPHLPTPPWQRPRPLVHLDAPPSGLAAFDPFAWHHIALIQAGVRAARPTLIATS